MQRDGSPRPSVCQMMGRIKWQKVKNINIKNVRRMLKCASIEDWLIKTHGLKHSSFGNDKAPQSMYG